MSLFHSLQDPRRYLGDDGVARRFEGGISPASSWHQSSGYPIIHSAKPGCSRRPVLSPRVRAIAVGKSSPFFRPHLSRDFLKPSSVRDPFSPSAARGVGRSATAVESFTPSFPLRTRSWTAPFASLAVGVGAIP